MLDKAERLAHSAPLFAAKALRTRCRTCGILEKGAIFGDELFAIGLEQSEPGKQRLRVFAITGRMSARQSEGGARWRTN